MSAADAVRDVLSRANVSGLNLVLPSGQLDRKLYVAVNDVIERIGGKWSKKARAHVFESDPREALSAFLTSGETPEKNPDAFFPTPLAVIQRMMLLANNTRFGSRVLEPSAGKGAIVNYVRTWHPDMIVKGVEMNERRATILRQLGLDVDAADFLAWTPSAPFDLVLMNPPFAVERDASEWMEHVRHAHGMLAPSGVLVSVVPASYRFRADKRHIAFREWAEAQQCAVVELPPDAFRESGTGVNCLLLRLRVGSLAGGRET